MIDTVYYKFWHWFSDTFILDDDGELSTNDLESAFRAGFERGRSMERAMWELAKSGQEWEEARHD